MRFREHDEFGSRMRRLGVAYRSTKYNKFGHNSRKFHSKEYDPNALKRKRKTPRTKVSSRAAETKGVSKTNAPESVLGINDPNLDALLEEMMTAFEDQIDATQTEQAQSQVCNPTPNVAQTEKTQAEEVDQAVDKVVEKKKKVTKVVEKKKQVVKAIKKKKQVAKAVDKKKKVDKKNTQSPKKSSDRLKYVCRSKINVGSDSTSTAPLVVDEEPSVKKMRS
ncbi:hypothetical protein KIW84_061188 [Lathyrus oleraceus]|uniref:Uncharacterized protein n=1 Tax=Pisum sativum TaxID=3888 RepID=A0A9D4W304_PEA|nr:hypothetical protein KIW84_061188 [Pisum sativum]